VALIELNPVERTAPVTRKTTLFRFRCRLASVRLVRLPIISMQFEIIEIAACTPPLSTARYRSSKHRYLRAKHTLTVWRNGCGYPPLVCLAPL